MLKPMLLINLTSAIVSVLLLSISVAQADEDGPNPGDDNPGSTTTTLDYFVGANLSLDNGCFETSEWCTEQFLDASVAVEVKGKGKNAATASASAYAALGCGAAASADAGASVWFEGGGELNLTRHGSPDYVWADLMNLGGALTSAARRF